jgi:hypothetical protein
MIASLISAVAFRDLLIRRTRAWLHGEQEANYRDAEKPSSLTVTSPKVNELGSNRLES